MRRAAVLVVLLGTVLPGDWFATRRGVPWSGPGWESSAQAQDPKANKPIKPGEEGEIEIRRPQLAEQVKKPLTAELTVPNSINSRSGAPFPIAWKLTWKGKGLLEGRMTFQLFDDGIPIGSFALEELAISGEQSYRMMIPAVRSPADIDVVDVRGTFYATDGKTYDLGPQSVKIPQIATRHVMLMLCDVTDVSLSPQAGDTMDALDLTQFERKREQLVTQDCRYRAQDMPNDPLSLCGADVIAITSQGFSELRDPQLEALRQWVEAGGALFLMPGSGLQERHLKFLNRLSKEDFPDTPLQRGEKGALTGLPFQDGWVGLRRGLGRVVLVSGMTAPKRDERSTSNRREWERMAAYLWRVPLERLSVQDEGTFWGGLPPPQDDRQQFRPTSQFGVQQGYGFEPKSRYYPRLAGVGDWLLLNLLPPRIEVVPLWLLAILLGGYLLLIGPAEYFGLGALKMRRVTWVLFPITTFAFTGGVMWLSNHYMYSKVESRSLIVADVIDDGTIARQNRFQLVFTNAHRKLVHDEQHALLTPLDLTAFGANLTERNLSTVAPEDYDPFHNAAWHRQGSAAQTVEYVGMVPSHYKVIQNSPQWTPQLNRIFSIAPPIPKGIPLSREGQPDVRVEFPWTSFSKADFATADGQARVGQVVQDLLGNQASAYLYLPGIHTDPRGRFGGEAGFDMMRALVPPKPENRFRFLVKATEGPDFVSVITPLSVNAADGLATFVSRLSPAGGSNFEDLPLLDYAMGDECLLVLIVPHENEYYVYRRLYR